MQNPKSSVRRRSQIPTIIAVRVLRILWIQYKRVRPFHHLGRWVIRILTVTDRLHSTSNCLVTKQEHASSLLYFIGLITV